MRTMITHDKMAFVAVVLVLLLLLTIPLGSLKAWLYPLVRDMAQAKLNYETRSMAVYETTHFTIKYSPSDAAMVSMVAEAAEAAYSPVTDTLGAAPKGKTLLVVYPDRKELNKVFGWANDQSAMGVYWGGVIQLLSPKEWLQAGESTAEFIRSGPMVHEFTHLVFDHMTNGNYTRWFTEGLAQYVEYKANGYEWISKTNSLAGGLYSQQQLDANFDNLPDQSLAYRQSLAAVRYIAEVHGEAKLHEVIQALQDGQSTPEAISSVLGMTYDEFGTAWTQWAKTHMTNKK